MESSNHIELEIDKFNGRKNSIDSLLSKSMIIERDTDKSYHRASKWISDDLVTVCMNKKCGITFTMFTRKHHCRSCFLIFCHNCSPYFVKIPENFGLIRNDNKYWNSTPCKSNIAVRVCTTCNDTIKRYKQVSKSMETFSKIDLDIIVLKKMKSVNKLWRDYAEFKLNKFRELQYVLPNYTFSELEKKLLWENYYYLIHHPKYLIQLFKSLDHESYEDRNDKLLKILDLLNNSHKAHKLSCETLMCTRFCASYDSDKINIELSPEDAICLLDDKIKNVEIRKYAIKSYKNIQHDEFMCYLPFLVFSMKHESIEHSVVGSFLIEKCMSEKNTTVQLEFCTELYWEISIHIDEEKETNVIKMYKYFKDKLENEMPSNITQTIRNQKKFVKTLVNIYSLGEDTIKKKLIEQNYKQVAVPINSYREYALNIDDIYVKRSAQVPIVLPLTFKNNNNTTSNYNIMFKFEDIRKDQTVMKMIKLIEIILKKYDAISMPIVTYKIRPTGPENGFIELVPDSETINNVKERKFTLLNYIIEHNKGESADNIKKKFVRSCAIYCVITYIFGIGDRHLDNIMITRDGKLFHIDFSYILGDDPKLMTAPTMRVSATMVDAIGGENSQYYKDFKKLCVEIFNVLRRHVNLFIMMMSILENREKNITMEKIYDTIIGRLCPGTNKEHAGIQLDTIIENSSETYNSSIIDIFHNYGKQKTYVQEVSKSVASSIFGFFNKS